MQFLSLDQEDPLEKEMATHYSILAWEISSHYLTDLTSRDPWGYCFPPERPCWHEDFKVEYRERGWSPLTVAVGHLSSCNAISGWSFLVLRLESGAGWCSYSS